MSSSVFFFIFDTDINNFFNNLHAKFHSWTYMESEVTGTQTTVGI